MARRASQLRIYRALAESVGMAARTEGGEPDLTQLVVNQFKESIA